MAVWEHKEQERENQTYLFSGSLWVTEAVSQELTPGEILIFYLETKRLAKERGGLDYFQRFEDDRGRRLYLIDNLNKETLESGLYEPEDNSCVLVFDYEY